MKLRRLLAVAFSVCILSVTQTLGSIVTNPAGGNILQAGVGSDEPLKNLVGLPTNGLAVIDHNATAWSPSTNTTHPTKTSTYLTTNTINALSNLYVITFNSAPGSGTYAADTGNGLNNIEAMWQSNHKATLTDARGHNNNFGGINSNGRIAISGSQSYMTIGPISSGAFNPTDPLIPATETTTFLVYDVSPTSATEYVSAAGIVIITRTNDTDQIMNPRLTVRFTDPTDASGGTDQYTSRIATAAIGGTLNAAHNIFFGIQVPSGCRINRVYMTAASADSPFLTAFDEFAFQVTAVPPPQGTLFLIH